MRLLIIAVLVCVASVPTLADGVQQKGEDIVRLQIARLIEQCEELVDIAMFESVDSAVNCLDSLNDVITNSFGESDTLLAMTYHVLSRCHHWRGDYDLAGAYAHKAISVWEKEVGPNHFPILNALDMLVEGGLQKHDLVSAEQYSDRCFQILESLTTPRSPEESERLIVALNNRGRLRVLQNRLEEGKEDFLQGLDLITDDIAEPLKIRAFLIGNLGYVSGYMDKLKESNRYFIEAGELIREAYHPSHPLVLTSEIFLGVNYLKQSEYEKADSVTNVAISLCEEIYGQGRPKASTIYQTRSKLFLSQGSYDQAVEAALRAVAVNKDNIDYPTNKLMGSLENAGNVALGVGRYDLAGQIFDELVETRHTFLKTVFGYASGSQKLSYLSLYPAIINTLLSGSIENSIEELNRVALDMVLNGKGLAVDAMASEFSAAACSEDSSLDSLLSEHRTSCSKIAQLSLSRHGGEESVQQTLRELYARKSEIETRLSSLCSKLDFGDNSETVSASTVASSLPENSVLWEIVKYPRIDIDRLYKERSNLGYYYAAVSLTPNEDITFIDLGKAASIDSLVVNYHAVMSGALSDHLRGKAAQSYDRYSETVAKLYSRVVAPLEASLHDVKKVYVAPDGMLSLLPFETLVDKYGRYLIEDYRFTYLTSGRDLLKEKQESGSSKVIVMADPDYMTEPSTLPMLADTETAPIFASRGNIDPPECLGSMFSPLPLTRQEGATIARLFSEANNFDVEYLTASHVREGVLKDLVVAPRVLHIASHGYFCESAEQVSMSNPLLRSGLILAGANHTIGGLDGTPAGVEDGILTALEASGLSLLGTDLVVLSACQTGVGEVQNGEGVFGLRRSFQIAGVRSMIMSMYAIPDEATASLMESFYSDWLSGQSKSVALRNASLSILNEMRGKDDPAHPLFWGGFILVGDPN